MNIYDHLQSLSAAILDDSDAPTLLARFKTVNLEVNRLTEKLSEYESVLRMVAAPKRPDGTFNRCREACQELAAEVLAEPVSRDGLT